MTTSVLLANLSGHRRRAWVQVAVPRSAVASFSGSEATFLSMAGHRFRAVRGEDRGDTSTIYRVRGYFDDTGELLEGKLVDEVHADAGKPFRPHRWVTDDPHALVATLLVRATSGQTYRAKVVDARLVEHDEAHQRYLIRSRIDDPDPVMRGLWLHWWADILHDDPVVRFWGLVRWSARLSPELDLRVAAIGIETGETVAIECGRLLGCSDPIRAGAKWVTILGTDLALPDGSGLAFCGEMPTFVASPSSVDLPGNQDDRDSYDDLLAAMAGPVYGVGTDFERWLACGYVPRVDDVPYAQALADLRWFEDRARNGGRWNDARRLGCGPNPGATGDQEDFGATKGTWALLDPRHLREYLYCAYAESLRGTLHLEDDGAIVRASAHPNWFTWSGWTHRTGSDRLGKREEVWGDRRSNGWNGYDDEHHSMNLVAAVSALRDDPLIDTLVEHQLETDLASHRQRTSAWDAARAHGRCAQAYAQLASASPLPAHVFNNLAQHRHETCVAQIAGTSSPESIMRPIALVGPDPRKPIRDPVTGELMQVAVCFEHGLAMVGLLIAERRWQEKVVVDLVSPLTECAVFLLRYGALRDFGGAWQLMSDVAWLGGQDLPMGTLAESSLVIAAGNSGVGNWTLAGIMAAVEYLAPSQDAVHRELVERGRSIVQQFTHGREATSRRGAEWWAVVESVASVAGTV